MKRLISFSLALIYVLLIGFGQTPEFLGATVFGLLLLSTLILLLKRERPTILKKPHYLAIVILTAFNLIGFGINSNKLVRLFSTLSVAVSYFYLLNIYLFGKKQVSSGHYYLAGSLTTIGKWFKNIISFTNFIQFTKLNQKQEIKNKILNKEVWIGLAFSVPVLIVFNALFKQINVEYATFINSFLDLIWDIITNLWQYLKTFVQIFLSAYIFFSLLNLRRDVDHAEKSEGRSLPQDRVATFIGAIVVLFAIFEIFQSKLIFTGLGDLSFKQMSLYVQQGFWELLTVAFMGYGLLLFLLSKQKLRRNHQSKLFKLLIIFNSQLLLVSLFTHHKLFLHESIFGLKDQRVLASLATGLVSLTFLLSYIKLIGKIQPKKVLAIQIISLLTVMAGVNLFNLELIMTRTHPIRYYLEDQPHKDYSYLLGNSFDNHAAWLNLIHEAQQVGIEHPNDYYWGNYHSLRVRSSTVGQLATHQSFLRSKYQYLEDKYQPQDKSIKEKLKFNWHEYQAYRLYQNNQSEFKRFIKFVEE